MNKLLLIFVPFLILASALLYFITTQDKTQTLDQASEEKVEKRAKFLIYTHNTLRDFSDKKYHDLSSKVYVTSDSPEEIIVKMQGTTWDSFFKTLPMKLDENCLITGTGQTFCTDQINSLKFYVNGSFNSAAPFEEINDGDRLLISFGPINDPNIDSQLEALENLR